MLTKLIVFLASVVALGVAVLVTLQTPAAVAELEGWRHVGYLIGAATLVVACVVTAFMAVAQAHENRIGSR